MTELVGASYQTRAQYQTNVEIPNGGLLIGENLYDLL